MGIWIHLPPHNMVVVGKYVTFLLAVVQWLKSNHFSATTYVFCSPSNAHQDKQTWRSIGRGHQRLQQMAHSSGAAVLHAPLGRAEAGWGGGEVGGWGGGGVGRWGGGEVGRWGGGEVGGWGGGEVGRWGGGEVGRWGGGGVGRWGGGEVGRWGGGEEGRRGGGEGWACVEHMPLGSRASVTWRIFALARR